MFFKRMDFSENTHHLFRTNRSEQKADFVSFLEKNIGQIFNQENVILAKVFYMLIKEYLEFPENMDVKLKKEIELLFQNNYSV
jgi:hypothetical protein